MYYVRGFLLNARGMNAVFEHTKPGVQECTCHVL
ncbi:hypothetical protein C5S35_11760, partial [Candidatus Methanophagaceae archaeon]